MKTLLISLFSLINLSFSLTNLRWGHHKPHLIYSFSEKDLFPTIIRLAFCYSDAKIPVRYDLREGDPNDLLLNYNYNNARDFSEQTIYDKLKGFQFKTATIREEIRNNPAEQWSLQIFGPKPKGFVKEMLEDFTNTLIFRGESGAFETDTGFMRKRESSKANAEELVIFAISIGFEQFSQGESPKDYYIMRSFDEENAFLIRNRSNHEPISLIKLGFFQESSWKPLKFDYKFLQNSQKTHNWRVGQELKDFARSYNDAIASEFQENSLKNTVLLVRFAVKLSDSDFLFHLLYNEDVTSSTQELESDYNTLFSRLQGKRAESLRTFVEKLPINTASDSEFLQCSLTAASNLLGSLTYMHGEIKTSANPHVYTQPRSLLAISPCRKGFARGFLWDDGFHNLLVSQLDAELSLEIIKHWLDTVYEDTGWVPREQIRGAEAEFYANADFLVQNEREANPPTLILVLYELFRRAKEEGNAETVEEIAKLWPKAKKWFDWFHKSQRVSGEREENLFQWSVRRGIFNLGSGMDDYPRGDAKFHLDLQVWNIVFAQFLLPLMEELGAGAEEISEMKAILAETKENLRRFFRDPTDLLYKDTDGGHNFSPHIGYDNLFPLMFGLLERDSEELGSTLAIIRDEEKLWSNAGLRSLSRRDRFYRKNDNYWTAPVWININYMVLRGIKLFYWENQRARELYEELRRNLMRNVCGQWKETGFFWETFDDLDLKGTHHSLFNGWTSLISLIISEKYV